MVGERGFQKQVLIRPRKSTFSHRRHKCCHFALMAYEGEKYVVLKSTKNKTVLVHTRKVLRVFTTTVASTVADVYQVKTRTNHQTIY